MSDEIPYTWPHVEPNNYIPPFNYVAGGEAKTSENRFVSLGQLVTEVGIEPGEVLMGYHPSSGTIYEWDTENPETFSREQIDLQDEAQVFERMAVVTGAEAPRVQEPAAPPGPGTEKTVSMPAICKNPENKPLSLTRAKKVVLTPGDFAITIKRGEKGNRILCWPPNSPEPIHLPLSPLKKGWSWNEDYEEATLSPSIQTLDEEGNERWHGYLTEGVWSEQKA